MLLADSNEIVKVVFQAADFAKRQHDTSEWNPGD